MASHTYNCIVPGAVIGDVGFSDGSPFLQMRDRTFRAHRNMG
jgi:hypothetical protein